MMDRLFARLSYDGFGLVRQERAQLFREVADAAADTSLPFWIVAFLSGAIATFGLLQGSAAVVIGAMLVAPLLGPLTGLAMSIAVGDARLFVQSGVTVALVAIGIIVLAAGITLAMPIAPMTDEIAARMHPNLIDLLVAIASGTAAAAVTASRNTRLSASIPGVAVAVALVPPLGVAGYGLGIGWDWDIFGGAMLLFGANLAGIVLSGELVYMALGMAREITAETADEWHEEDRGAGIARQVDDLPALQDVNLGTMRKRVLLTLAFAGLVSIPLVTAFNQLVRDFQVSGVADQITNAFEQEHDAYVVSHSVSEAGGTATLYYRLLARAPIAAERIAVLRSDATAKLGRPVKLEISQQIASSASEMAQAKAEARIEPAPAVAQIVTTQQRIERLGERVAAARSGLLLPASAEVLETGVFYQGGQASERIVLTLGIPAELAEREWLGLVRRQFAGQLTVPPETVTMRTVPIGLADPANALDTAARLQRYPSLIATITADEAGDATVSALRSAGIAENRIERAAAIEGVSRVRLCVAGRGSRICERARPPAESARQSAADPQ